MFHRKQPCLAQASVTSRLNWSSSLTCGMETLKTPHAEATGSQSPLIPSVPFHMDWWSFQRRGEKSNRPVWADSKEQTGTVLKRGRRRYENKGCSESHFGRKRLQHLTFLSQKFRMYRNKKQNKTKQKKQNHFWGKAEWERNWRAEKSHIEWLTREKKRFPLLWFFFVMLSAYN